MARADCEPRSATAATLREAGIHRIRVPGPFGVGPTNAYLLDDEPLTLVDPGPNWVTSLEGLERGLVELGHTIGDLGMIVLTHQHVDHEGLAGYLARRTGAEVACLDLLAPYLSTFETSIAADYQVRDETMRAHGLDAALADAARPSSILVQQFGGAVTATRRVPAGGVVELRDRRLRFLFRPGHSPSDTVLLDEDRAIAIAGDHLLPKITSNALLDRSLLPGAGLSRTRALVDYRASLRATRELELAVALPGHGEPIGDHRGLVDARFEAHERRLERLLELLDGKGPRTARSLAVDLWGETTCLMQPFLTISEAVGHLDLLLDRGLVVERSDGGMTTFELA